MPELINRKGVKREIKSKEPLSGINQSLSTKRILKDLEKTATKQHQAIYGTKKDEEKIDDIDYMKLIFDNTGGDDADFSCVDPLTFVAYRRKHQFQNKNIQQRTLSHTTGQAASSFTSTGLEIQTQN